MLAYAFDEHPLFRLAFPKAASRSTILQTLFATILKDAIRFGRVDVACSHKIVGMLIWYPPGCYPMSKSRILRLLMRKFKRFAGHTTRTRRSASKVAGFYSATRDRVMPPLHGLLLLRRVQIIPHRCHLPWSSLVEGCRHLA
jgi:hypothetical protein